MITNPSICDIKYAQRATPVFIQNEEHTIKTDVPFSISLKEKPSEDHSVSIPDYTEITSSPTSDANFYVDYPSSIIYFHYTKAGESILVSYYGIGSPIVADDVNRFSKLFEFSKSSVHSFRVEALLRDRVRMYGGDFQSGTIIYTKKELFLKFGAGGNYEVSITEGYYKKIILGIDISTQQITKIEGTEVSAYDATQLPSYPSTFKPVAIITLGSDLNILQKDIINVRNFLI